MTQSQVIYQVMLHMEQFPQFELQGSGPDFVTYSIAGQDFAIFCEEQLNLWSPMFGDFKNIEEFKELVK